MPGAQSASKHFPEPSACVGLERTIPFWVLWQLATALPARCLHIACVHTFSCPSCGCLCRLIQSAATWRFMCEPLSCPVDMRPFKAPFMFPSYVLVPSLLFPVEAALL